MPLIKDLKKINTLEGIQQYIVIDHHGNIISQNSKAPETMARILASCGKNFYAIGKSNFKFCVFSRKNKQDFFIFPVGKYYLGVIKQKDINRFVLTDAIVDFLTEVMEKDRTTRRPI